MGLKNHLILFVLLVAVMLSAGCTGEKQNLTEKNAHDEAACIASGGEMVPSSTIGGRDLFCYHAPKDSGKPCSDNSECEKFCITSCRNESTPVVNITGSCAGGGYPYDDFYFIENRSIKHLYY